MLTTWAVLKRPATSARPNIVLITMDTTRADALHCYDPNGARTPNIDLLAGQGVRFDTCCTCTSLTLPSHSSLMTSLYPHETDVRINGDRPLPAACLTLAEVLHDHGYRTEAVIGAFVLNRQFGLAQGFDNYHDFSAEGVNEATSSAERPGDQVCAQALDALRASESAPLFLWVHFYDPHEPYDDHGTAASTPRDAYLAEVTFVDEQIGRLMRDLQTRGAAENTVLVIVGDHGEGLGDHDELYHGFFTYQSTLRVPLIISAPGRLPSGKLVVPPVRTLDVAPTILDLAGVPVPQQWRGISLNPVMSGNVADPDLDLYAEAIKGHFQFGFSPLRALISGGWKYILGPNPKLYHLVDDPDETRNLIDSEALRAGAMREQMRSLIANSAQPPTYEDEVAELDADSRAKIESLGYVGGGRTDDRAIREIDRFEPSGVDPGNYTGALGIYGTAERLVQTGQMQRGEQLLRQVIDMMPVAALPKASLAHALQMQRRFDEARALYDEAMALEPGNLHIRRMLAGMLITTRAWSELGEVAAQVIAADPGDADMWFDLGVSLGMQDKLQEARPHFEMAYKLAPYNVRFVHGMGQLCYREGNYKRAVAYFEEALQLNPEHRPSKTGLQKARTMLDQTAAP